MSQAATFAITAAEIDRAVNRPGGVAAWVHATAQRQAVAFTPGPLDVFAHAVSRLSDAEVHLDVIEDLLLALYRARLITDPQRFALHAAYLRQQP